MILDIVIDSICLGIGIFGILTFLFFNKELKRQKRYRNLDNLIWRRDYRALMLQLPDNGKAMIELHPGLWVSKPSVEEVRKLSEQIKVEVDKL